MSDQGRLNRWAFIPSPTLENDQYHAHAKMQVIWDEGQKVSGSSLNRLNIKGSWFMATNFIDTSDYAPPRGCCIVAIRYIGKSNDLRGSVRVGLNHLGISPDGISPFLKRITSWVTLKQAADLVMVRAAGATFILHENQSEQKMGDKAQEEK